MVHNADRIALMGACYTMTLLVLAIVVLADSGCPPCQKPNDPYEIQQGGPPCVPEADGTACGECLECRAGDCVTKCSPCETCTNNVCVSICPPCYGCDTNGQCSIFIPACDHNPDIPGNDSCYTCDHDGDGTPEACFQCDHNPNTPGVDACYTCDLDKDGELDSCFTCDHNPNLPGKDDCYKCARYNTNGIPDSCYTCDHYDAVPGMDACYACDLNDDGLADVCFVKDTDGDGVNNCIANPVVETNLYSCLNYVSVTAQFVKVDQLVCSTPTGQKVRICAKAQAWVIRKADVMEITVYERCCPPLIVTNKESGKVFAQWQITGRENHSGDGFYACAEVSTPGEYDVQFAISVTNTHCPPPTLTLRTNIAVLKAEFPIEVTAFIPQDHLVDPFGDVFEGDGRSFDKNATSYRMRQKVTVVSVQECDADGLKDGTIANLVGTTRSYDSATSFDPVTGNLTAAAKADMTKGAPLMIDYATASSSGMNVTVNRVSDRKVEAVIIGSAANPLVFGAPAIDYDFTILIDSTDPLHPTYTITGSHDGFPAYEVYINDQRIYEHDPIATGEGPGSLFPPKEHDVDDSGDVQ